MKKQDAQYRGYVTLLKKELVPAMGCTEPIAIAYAAAQAAARLKEDIKQVDIYASGNIIKNVKSVTVPNTGGRKGIQSAAAIGIIAGDPTLGLEVIYIMSSAAVPCRSVSELPESSILYWYVSRMSIPISYVLKRMEGVCWTKRHARIHRSSWMPCSFRCRVYMSLQK